jgi:hypothetical protein
MTAVNTYELENADDSFPYVLVSSLLGALVSLASASGSQPPAPLDQWSVPKLIANPLGPARGFAAG